MAPAAVGVVGGAGSLVLEERFSIVPEWVLDADVSDAAVRLYAVLLRFGATSGQRMPSRRTLADRLRKKSVDSVDRALKELVAIGAVEVTRRSRDGLNLTNRYLVRSTRPGRQRPAPRSGGGGRTDAATPGAGGPPAVSPTTGGTPVGECRRVGGGRRSAARGGRTGAARVAATVRPDRESSTENSPPPPGPSSTDSTGRVSRAGREAGGRGRSQRTARPGAGHARPGRPRGRRGTLRPASGRPRPTGRSVDGGPARRRAGRGGPGRRLAGRGGGPGAAGSRRRPGDPQPGPVVLPGAVVGRLGATSRRSPADHDRDGEDGAAVADLEAVLVETGGLRVALQRQARAELSGEGVPLTRSSVIRRAVDILRRGEQSAVPVAGPAPVAQALSVPPSTVGVPTAEVSSARG